MKREVSQFVAKCATCQRVKVEHMRPMGLLQPLEVPEWKWESIAMDFVTGLPRLRWGMNTIWVVVDRLTKSAVFIPMRLDWSMSQLAQAYVQHVVKRFGVPKDIVSDRDSRFLSHFWKEIQAAFGTHISMSTAWHPQSDGQTERTIRTLEDMLRACMLDFQGNWEDHLSLVEFAYNNSYHSSIKMAPFEALYGRRCRTPLCWNDSSDRLRLGPDYIRQSTEFVRQIRDRMKEAQDRQKSYADLHRRDIEFAVGDMVLLRVSPVRGVRRFGKKGKLSPRFIGPYEIVERIGKVSYRLALPAEVGNVHDVFHISQLRKFISDPDKVIKPDEVRLDASLEYEEKPMAVIDVKEKVLRNKTIRMVKILWSRHGREDATWETEEAMKAKYPEFDLHFMQ